MVCLFAWIVLFDGLSVLGAGYKEEARVHPESQSEAVRFSAFVSKLAIVK